MDVRKPAWFGQIQISGVGAAINHEGSILSIVSESLKDLQAQNPRALANGNREIIIRIRDKPFSHEKESEGQLEKVLQVSTALEIEDSEVENGPIAGEEFDDYFMRLCNEGTPESVAMMIACDWFQRDAPVELTQWLTDTRMIRFRLLTANREAYESAHPTEYRQLLLEAQERFPQFVKNLKLREA